MGMDGEMGVEVEIGIGRRGKKGVWRLEVRGDRGSGSGSGRGSVKRERQEGKSGEMGRREGRKKGVWRFRKSVLFIFFHRLSGKVADLFSFSIET